jgi:hypothetical protein
MKKSKVEIKNRILAFTKKQRFEDSPSPTEVTKNLFTDVWKAHVDDVRAVAGEIHNQKLIKVAQHGDEGQLDLCRRPIQLTIFNDKK